MSVALLRTKLYIPQSRPNLVARPRLIHRLSEGFERKLTLVSAPPGFGKSTILSEWASSVQHPVAWLSLDPADNEFARFWSYTMAALQTVLPPLRNGAATLADGPGDPAHHQTALVHLINTIAETAIDRFGLVFDDLHVITEPHINDALVFLVDNLPPQMHLMLTSRADPPWPLARLRARGELSEIRADDLRFTAAEAAAFLNDVMGLALAPDDIAALEERTEGWIAGLQMAALSMRGREDLSGFIQSLSGSHRFIMDYLVEEVLERQPPTVRDFLLRTSILDQLSAPLCDAVTGDNGSQAMLAELEQRNLFLTPQDDMRRWYRYHHLFGNLLQSRMLAMQPDQVADLHRRASTWYEQNGQLAEAMRHAQASGDLSQQIRLIAQNVLTMAYLGELTTLVEWLDALPQELGRNQPWFCVSRAWVTIFAGHVDAVEAHLQAAENVIAQTGSAIEPGERDHIRGHIAAIHAYALALRGDLDQSDAASKRALALLPEQDVTARGWITLLLAISPRTKGNYTAAEEAFAAAASLARSGNVIPLLVDILWEESQMQLWQGRLHASLRTCQEVLRVTATHRQRTGRPLPPTGYVYAGVAAVLYEWNDLDGAFENAQEAVRLSKRWGMGDALVRTHQQLAKVLQARGDTEGALAALHEARRAAAGISTMYASFAETSLAQLQLRQGKIEAVAEWAAAKGFVTDAEFEFAKQTPYALLARLRLAQAATEGDVARKEALSIAERLLMLAQKNGTSGPLIEALILKALALRALGEDAGACDALQQALNHGELEGFIRIFVNEGAPLHALLRQIVARNGAIPYVTRLLAAFGDSFGEEQSRNSPTRPPQPLAEPLTDRELDVLRLLRTDLSSTEIAETLIVAASTVRTHIKSIYGKLDVHGRDHAVERAIELGLL